MQLGYLSRPYLSLQGNAGQEKRGFPEKGPLLEISVSKDSDMSVSIFGPVSMETRSLNSKDCTTTPSPRLSNFINPIGSLVGSRIV